MTPVEPDYSEPSSWFALPHKIDGADIIPAHCGEDRQADAVADTFFVHPTSFFGDGPNGATDDFVGSFLTNAGQLPQQASAFSSATAIYAPKYRQVSQGLQETANEWNWDAPGTALEEAMELAYSDVERAFLYFADHYSVDRPWLIASHSQGTMHAKRLLARLLPSRPTLAARLVGAYLIGNTVEENEVPGVAVCSYANQTACIISWNAVLDGGTDGDHWIRKAKRTGKPVCVNPLTWTRADGWADQSLALGALPMLGHLFLSELRAHVASARCASDGILYIQLRRGIH